MGELESVVEWGITENSVLSDENDALYYREMISV